jgi:homoserine dehydrogenase
VAVTQARADLALIGFGNVAKRFATLLDERREWLANECDLDWRVVGVATRSHGARFDPDGIELRALISEEDQSTTPAESSSPLDVIARLGQSDAALRIVVETTTLDIRGGQPAIDHVRAGIAAGCHVITANKGPVAFAYAELRDAAAAAGVSFLFEGAVMDGVPIFNLVRETLPAVEIAGFRGVINSTTNHILTALERGEEFGAALARMQAEGIAEADPSLDVDGWDAAAKVAALANVLLDARITPHDVHRTGISANDAVRAQDARSRGRRVKLIASASRAHDGVIATVEPRELPADDLLAALDGKANALLFRTDLLGEIAICQLDGHLTHTAYALLSDLVTVRRRQRARAEVRVRRTL